VRRTLSDVAGYALIAGIAVAAVALLDPGHSALALDAYLLFLGALALLAATRVARHLTTSGEPSELESLVRPPKPHWWDRRRRRQERQQLPELARVEREVSLASGSAFDLHVRLRPTIREIAEHRLLSRYGVALEANPHRARELLGETTWDLVRPDRQPPSYRHAPGLPPAKLEEIVDSLERL
jgi:hypothetical protein